MIAFIKSFIEDCMLFKSHDKETKLMGIFMWLDIALLIYVIFFY